MWEDFLLHPHPSRPAVVSLLQFPLQAQRGRGRRPLPEMVYPHLPFALLPCADSVGVEASSGLRIDLVSAPLLSTEHNIVTTYWLPWLLPLSTPCPAHSGLPSGPVAPSKQRLL